jgi:hypothetical protein
VSPPSNLVQSATTTQLWSTSWRCGPPEKHVFGRGLRVLSAPARPTVPAWPCCPVTQLVKKATTRRVVDSRSRRPALPAPGAGLPPALPAVAGYARKSCTRGGTSPTGRSCLFMPERRLMRCLWALVEPHARPARGRAVVGGHEVQSRRTGPGSVRANWALTSSVARPLIGHEQPSKEA